MEDCFFFKLKFFFKKFFWYDYLKNIIKLVAFPLEIKIKTFLISLKKDEYKKKETRF